ncbi:PAS domain-containing sensor histidine kinase [Brevundimonas aveniformis]|uniref:PAS domain-containing sensor histidine kinase n=1 Tax=Brevundimonas aveniformis TaxID=370977 RepID=UPI0012EB0558|nr:PAS domain-containing protein [Brevundimonas aveniformis]
MRMIMEGDVNWVLVLGLALALATAIALLFIFLTSRAAWAYRNATVERDRFRTEAEIHETRLNQILTSLPVALVETDTQGRFIFANRAAHHLLGRKDQELIGLRFHSATWGITYPDGRLIPPELLPNARALRGQTVKGFQHVIAHPGTKRRLLVSVTAMPILNSLGQVIGSSAAIVEIDSLNPAASPEAELTRRVFDAAPNPVLVIGAEGQVREANAAVARMLGLDADALRGRPFAELISPEHRWEAVNAFAAQVIQSGEVPASAIEESLTVGQERRFVRWTAMPLPLEDAIDAVLLVGEDVTDLPFEETDTHATEQADTQAALAELTERLAIAEQARTRAEAQAEETQTALNQTLAASEARRRREDSNTAEGRRLEDIGRMTGGLATDFNALLTLMLGALDMIGRQADNPERVRRVAEAALTAGRRGEVLTRQLSAYSRGDETTLRALDVGTIVRGLPSPIQAGAVEVQVAENAAYARFDPVRLQSALTALMINARQAQGPTEPIRVRIESASVADGDPDLVVGDYVKITVSDRGPGMDPDVLVRAQEPFFTTRPGAEGLGLAQARGFARSLGGALRLGSTPGVGSTAAIWLPRVPTEIARAEQNDTPAIAG